MPGIRAECLRELEAEAQRIVIHDHTVHLAPQSLKTRQKYDFTGIGEETLRSYKFLKASQHGVHTAELREEVGVFVCDDIVPMSLHSAVSSFTQTHIRS